MKTQEAWGEDRERIYTFLFNVMMTLCVLQHRSSIGRQFSRREKTKFEEMILETLVINQGRFGVNLVIRSINLRTRGLTLPLVSEAPVEMVHTGPPKSSQ